MEPLTADDPQAIGGFRLQARLGAGAMGRVYLAAPPAGRMVAVKVLQPELARDQEFIRRFRAEVDAARLVGEIYTAPVVEAGVDDALPAAVVYRVVQEDPDLGKVPVHFRQLIQACLAKDPALRPDPALASMAGLAAPGYPRPVPPERIRARWR